MAFLDENYLLSCETAKQLYQLVKDLPIVDAHNHSDAREIVENKGWNDIWEAEAATDHYVWELMRRRGVPEEKITGKASNYEKWLALAEVFPKFVGNPTYEWIHLDLRRRFSINEIISKETAQIIWNKAKEKLQSDDMKPQKLLRDMNVEIMCTTNDPAEDLHYHELARERVEGVKILPTWRPDRFCKVHSPDFKKFVSQLEERTNVSITGLSAFVEALKKTHDRFAKLGCVCSDHALLDPIVHRVSESEASRIFEKALKEPVSYEEHLKFQSYMMYRFAEMNSEKDWAMQLHIGAMRDYRIKLFERLGPDSGGDIIAGFVDVARGMKNFFNDFDGKLRIVLYCMDTSYLPVMATIARAFENVFLGAPWWFNDSPFGMRWHLEYIASVDLLSNFVGMVTDSRKLMSYGSRTEMFRRVLCDVVGTMVERGQIPLGEAIELCRELSYSRPKEFFFGR
ncbi:glucuronate isomerase [Thermotoga sp. Ku-13t]|uniref:glucuronate isomerase n=1 Tax=Thermotoga sp. Ku-13t TaxID=1755813 RepID=UPI0013EDAAAE|nr:glucuronate isomerase [Thermotoga sp. Ku-13t]KAF2959008.1 glucuronate isomerase [Thermotoga sp. Ku-13t]